MAANKRAVALNLGMQTVTAAVFEQPGPGQLRLVAISRSELAPDPAADATRSGQLKIALGGLASSFRQAGQAVGSAIPAQGVFARFVTIPRVEPEKVGQVLFFEAQQNVPYPIEEVSWSYQVLPAQEADKLGALILATKLDQLESTVDAMRGSGFTPDLIESSPAALYNAFRYNYPDLTGCTLLIDIGARATNLVFAEENRLFIRTLPVGGNSITAALQKKLEDKPLTEIEALKVKEAFVYPFSAEGKTDEDMGKLARTVMTRVHNEITRSITHYRTNQQGSAPVRALIAGGGGSLCGVLEFFNEKLSLPVEFLNPLRRVSVASSVDAGAIATCAHSVGECVGIAARLLLDDAPLQVELTSPQVQAAKQDRKRRPFMLAALCLLALALGVAFLHFKTAADRLATVNAQLQKRASELQSLKQKLDAAASARRRLLDDAADLAAAPMLRTSWAAILDEISQRMPARNIWVTKLRPVSGAVVLDPAAKNTDWASPSAREEEPRAVTALEIDGLYLENESGPAVVDALVEALSQSPAFAIDAGNKNDVVKLRATPSGETWAYQYKLVLPLRRPIPL